MADGRLQLRSNITTDPDAWDLVPGDALYRYAPDRLKLPNRPTQRQRDEHMYYVPCNCGRRLHQIQLEGCTECAHGPTEAERERTIARHEESRQRIEAIRQSEQAT
jgi:hypothetical protein